MSLRLHGVKLFIEMSYYWLNSFTSHSGPLTKAASFGLSPEVSNCSCGNCHLTHMYTLRVDWMRTNKFCLRLCLAEATVELSLDSPQEKRKRDGAAKPTASASAAAPATSLSAAAGPSKPQPAAALEEVISFPVVLLYKMSAEIFRFFLSTVFLFYFSQIHSFILKS